MFLNYSINGNKETALNYSFPDWALVLAACRCEITAGNFWRNIYRNPSLMQSKILSFEKIQTYLTQAQKLAPCI